MNPHIHTYGCIAKDASGKMSVVCGFPVGPEAIALIQAFNADDAADFARLSGGTSDPFDFERPPGRCERYIILSGRVVQCSLATEHTGKCDMTEWQMGMRDRESTYDYETTKNAMRRDAARAMWCR